jgi:hypothetical protein
VKPLLLLLSFLVLMVSSAQAHEGCFQNPQLALVLVSFQAQQAMAAQADEVRYWAAARKANPSASPSLEAAEQASAEGGRRYCQAVAAPHAGSPMHDAIQWQCQAQWSRATSRRVWQDFLRNAQPASELAEPSNGSD